MWEHLPANAFKELRQQFPQGTTASHRRSERNKDVRREQAQLLTHWMGRFITDAHETGYLVDIKTVPNTAETQRTARRCLYVASNVGR